MKQRINRIVKWFLTCIILLVFVQFISVAAAAFGLLNWVPHTLELPLGPIEGIAVDGQNRLYVANSFLGHIQIYDTNGAFVRGWFADTRGGSFRIRMSAARFLEVAPVRKGTVDRYDEFGKLVLSNADTKAFSRLTHSMAVTAQDGTAWEVVDPFLLPRITGYKDGFRKIVTVQNRFHLWALTGTFPLFFFIVLAFILDAIEKFTKK